MVYYDFNLFYVSCTVIFLISFFAYVCRSKSLTGLMFDVNLIILPNAVIGIGYRGVLFPLVSIECFTHFSLATRMVPAFLNLIKRKGRVPC